MKTYCIYLRVSTKKQGASGLGIESQRSICENFIRQEGGTLKQEFVDVESGTHRDRKGLADAVAYCKQNNCALVVAKLDRLARDVEFCFRIINTGIDIHFCDMPQINTLLLGVVASVGQYERELTSDRTKKALAVKKAKGEKLGAASDKYKASLAAKDEGVRKKELKERGASKSRNFMNRADVVAFIKVVRRVFPASCEGDNAAEWAWHHVNTKQENRRRMLQMMQDFHEMSGVFPSWDFSDYDDKGVQRKLNSYIQSVRRAVKYADIDKGDVQDTLEFYQHRYSK